MMGAVGMMGEGGGETGGGAVMIGMSQGISI